MYIFELYTALRTMKWTAIVLGHTMSYGCNIFTVAFFIVAKDMKTIFFSSHDVSKPDAGSYLSEVRNLVLVL